MHTQAAVPSRMLCCEAQRDGQDWIALCQAAEDEHDEHDEPDDGDDGPGPKHFQGNFQRKRNHRMEGFIAEGDGGVSDVVEAWLVD